MTHMAQKTGLYFSVLKSRLGASSEGNKQGNDGGFVHLYYQKKHFLSVKNLLGRSAEIQPCNPGSSDALARCDTQVQVIHKLTP